MATRQVTVAKVTDATITGSATVTTPVVVSASGGGNIFAVLNVGPQYRFTVAAGTYTTVAAFVAALNAATATGTPSIPLANFAHFAVTGSKVKVTIFDPPGSGANGMELFGTVMTQAHLATVLATGGSGSPVRLWQTTIGYTGTPALTPFAGLFFPGTSNDPLPIVVENQGAHSVFIAQGTSATDVTKTNGQLLAAGASLAYSNIGTDKVYAVATTATVKISVSVGKRP